MDQLLSIYEEIIRGAEDHQIKDHLTNLLTDATTLGDAVKQVLDQARARVAAQQPQ